MSKKISEFNPITANQAQTNGLGNIIVPVVDGSETLDTDKNKQIHFDEAKKLINRSPFVTKTANYVLTLADEGSIIRMDVDSSNTVTVPPNSLVTFALGSTIFVRQHGTGQTSIVAGAGVIINAGSLDLDSQYSTIALVKVGSNEWDMFGTSTSALPALTVPGSPAVTVDSSSQLTITWTDTNTSPNETNIQVWHSTLVDHSDATLLATLAANSVSRIHSGLSASTTHYYRIKAKGDGTTTADSPFTSWVSATTSASGPTIASTAWKSRIDTAAAGKLIQSTDPGFAESVVCLINGGLTAAYDFRQFTLANKPAIVSSGIHGEPCVEIDSNKFMQQTGYAFYTGPLTIFLVIQPKTFANFKYIYSSASTGSRCDFAFWDDASTTQKAAMYAGDMPGLKMTSGLTMDQSVVICLKRAGGGNDKIFKNQTLEATGNAGSHNTYQGGALGLNGGGTDIPKVWFKEVAIFEGAMSDADILALNQEFQTKNGIS